MREGPIPQFQLPQPLPSLAFHHSFTHVTDWVMVTMTTGQSIFNMADHMIIQQRYYVSRVTTDPE